MVTPIHISILLLVLYPVLVVGKKSKPQCDLYMAESTIPNAGLGIFTSISKEKGETVGNGDICLPFIDIHWHNDDGFFYPFADYVWDGKFMGMNQEVGTYDVEAYWPGLDCAVNCNLALLNVVKAVPEYDEAGTHRTEHPGAGAFTPYHKGTTEVRRSIPPGGELFKFYGDNWFITRPHMFGNIPLSEDYGGAVQLLNKFTRSVDKRFHDEIYELVTGIKETFNFRLLNALPSSLEGVYKVIDAQDIGVLHQPTATRDVEWLEEHGKCIDHIIPGKSMIEGAGHGAFAKRNLSEGLVITGSPLHNIPSERFFYLYDSDKAEDRENNRTDHIIGKQLTINYCYSHPETTLFLCPYGAGVNYINHNKTLANVKIQWAKDGETGHNESWLEMSTNDRAWESSPSLALDYVALRDIKEGEELFLDYGDIWEEAWQDHVKNWKVADNWNDYTSAARYNAEHAGDALRTIKEQRDDPYPANLQMHCHSDLLEDDWRQSTFEWKNNDKGHNGYPCQVRNRDDVSNKYDILIFYVDNGEEATDDDEYRSYSVPRKSITFVDVPYTTDMHLLQAFRHPLTLPHELVPEAWKTPIPLIDASFTCSSA